MIYHRCVIDPNDYIILANHTKQKYVSFLKILTIFHILIVNINNCANWKKKTADSVVIMTTKSWLEIQLGWEIILFFLKT